ncbi:MAG: PEP-CTERM system TPR-repeat protein PrsT [Nitrospirae bacterium]|nr:PEP-CTERM system TPR-repeat protein PrsT [Nitrospirota bacterium]
MKKFLMILAVCLCLGCIFLAGCQGKTKDDLLKDGIKKIEEGNAPGAVVLLKSSLEKDPNFLDARYQLAKAYRLTGKFEQAEREIEKSIRMNPARSDLQLEQIRIFVEAGKPDRAIEEGKKYIASNPDSAEGFELLGTAHSLKQLWLEAEDYYNQSVKKDPERASASIGLAAVYINSGKTDAAKNLLNSIITKNPKNTKAYYMLAAIESSANNIEKALEHYKKISEINPNDPEAHYRTGMIYLNKSDSENADKTAKLLVDKFPKVPHGYIMQGIMLFNKKSYRESIAILQKSISVRPTIPAYYYLGLSHYALNENEMALSQIKRALEYNPKFSQARLVAAAIQIKQKRTDTAVEEIEKVINDDPKNSAAHTLLANAYVAEGKYDKAMKALDDAVAANPKIAQTRLKKGVLSLNLGDSRSAESEFRAALDVAPDALNTRMILASYYMHQKNTAKAVEILKQGISNSKRDAFIYNTLSSIALREGKQADALSYLAKAKAADPNYFQPYHSLAIYHIARGEHGKAIAEYSEVLKRDPKNVPALINTALTYDLIGNNAEALSYLNKAKSTGEVTGYTGLANYYVRKKDNKKALAVVDELIKAKPDLLDAYELKGRIFLIDKKYNDAVDAFQKLEQKNPEKAIALTLAAYTSAKDYNSALKFIDKHIDKSQRRAGLLAEKARLYAVMKDWPKAQDTAQRLIRETPRSAGGYIVLASVYEAQGSSDKAMEAIKTGIQIDSKNSAARFMLAGLYGKKKDYNQALAIYKDIQKQDSKNLQAAFFEGNTYEVMGKKSDAVKKYESILAKSEQFTPAINNLAYLYLSGYGKPEKALELALRAYKLSPERAEVQDTLGYALLRNSRNQDALKVMKTAASMAPANPTIQYHLALAYRANGEKSMAIDAVQNALKSKNFLELKDAEKLFSELKASKK